MADTVARFENDGYPVADWVKVMLAAGVSSFYQRDESGIATAYYCPQRGDYLPIVKDSREITVVGLEGAGGKLHGNRHGSVYDMGDGALLWAFETKHNSITPGLLECGWQALEYPGTGRI